MAETEVFSDIYLRTHIFRFLRQKPHASCTVCKRIIFWNPQRRACNYVRLYNHTFYCVACSKTELSGVSCTIA